MTAIMVRATACGRNYIDQFLKTGTVAVGWGGSGDLRTTSRAAVVSNLASVHGCIGHGAAAATTAIYGVYNAKIGDIVVMPNGKDVYLGEVIKEYWYDNRDIDASHIIGVKWQKKPFVRESLSDALQASLRNVRTVSSLDSYTSELSDMLKGASKIAALVASGSSYTFIFGGNKVVTISGIPERIEGAVLDDILAKLKMKLAAEERLIE